MRLLRNTLFLLALLFSSNCAIAQIGQIWPTQTLQRFDVDENGDIVQEYEPQEYLSYFIFINEKQIIHCTSDLTSLYTIIETIEGEYYTFYKVTSEGGNEYVFSFDDVDPEQSQVEIASGTGFVLVMDCLPMYETKVFESLGKEENP